MFGLEEILMKYFDKCGLELRSSSSPDKDSLFGLYLKLASQGNVEIGAEHKTDSLRYLILRDLDQWIVISYEEHQCNKTQYE